MYPKSYTSHSNGPRFYGVMVSTLDPDSSDPGSNPGRTYTFFSFQLYYQQCKINFKSVNSRLLPGTHQSDDNNIRCSTVVSIPACHAGDPGSIPGAGAFLSDTSHHG